MKRRDEDRSLHPGWNALILVVVMVIVIAGCLMQFANVFASTVPVTLTSNRSGLVMESGAKVKLRGVQVGRVVGMDTGHGTVSLALDIDSDKTAYIPENVEARIRATTAFGAKYVDLVMPEQPSVQQISAGDVLTSDNVSTEVNTVFENLVAVLHKVDPAKLNSVLSAFAEGLRGNGPAIGDATTSANEVLLALNPRAEVIRRDWQSLEGFGNTYAGAAPDLVRVFDNATATARSITANAGNLDRLLFSVIGFAQTGIDTVVPAKDNLVTAINSLEPTTRLLMKYNPSLTCLLVGSKKIIDPESEGGFGFLDKTGAGNGRSAVLDAALMLGDDPYRYPDNLPVVGAKGGPGGVPGCGSLPDASKNWPVRALVTDTGFGTGTDWRPNPGIGFPGWANYFPVTRGIPEPASIRNPGGPAPGPIPYPGAPPYGAPMYAPDGTPLYPGLPPAPAPGAPREDGPPPPGREPFSVPNPMEQQPTPSVPAPDPAAPSP